MTQQQFINTLIEMGYRNTAEEEHYVRFDLGDEKTVTIQEFTHHTNVYYDCDFGNGNSVEFTQHRIEDYQDVLQNIERFEVALGL